MRVIRKDQNKQARLAESHQKALDALPVVPDDPEMSEDEIELRRMFGVRSSMRSWNERADG